MAWTRISENVFLGSRWDVDGRKWPPRLGRRGL